VSSPTPTPGSSDPTAATSGSAAGRLEKLLAPAALKWPRKLNLPT
jgi:hypothetical protein